MSYQPALLPVEVHALFLAASTTLCRGSNVPYCGVLLLPHLITVLFPSLLHAAAGVEIRVTPAQTEVIIKATRTQNVVGEKGRRIRELTSLLQKQFDFPAGQIALFAEQVRARCDVWRCLFRLPIDEREGRGGREGAGDGGDVIGGLFF